MVICTPRNTGGANGLLVVNIQSVITTNFFIRVSDNDFGRAGVSGSVDWVAFGI